VGARRSGLTAPGSLGPRRALRRAPPGAEPVRQRSATPGSDRSWRSCSPRAAGTALVLDLPVAPTRSLDAYKITPVAESQVIS
jgi:hypothetical protein